MILENTSLSSDKEQLSNCIECECGSKINLSRDANQMGNAIKAHAEEHAKTKPDISSAEAEASRIEDLLTSKVFTAFKTI
jgi:hypothetical protein